MNQRKGKEKLEKTDYEIVSALLDFNSDRAEAHAAFLVACVFGLFALLSMLERSPRGSPDIVAYSVAYLILWSGGIWEVFNFYRYAARADHFRQLVRDTKPSLFEKPIENMEKGKAVFNDVQKAYKKRSKILHGGTGWIIEPKEVSGCNEIIRQSILRCISLYTQGYLNMGKTLDECMDDPEKHEELLKDAEALFGSLSEYRELQGSPSIRSWAIRN